MYLQEAYMLPVLIYSSMHGTQYAIMFLIWMVQCLSVVICQKLSHPRINQTMIHWLDNSPFKHRLTCNVSALRSLKWILASLHGRAEARAPVLVLYTPLIFPLSSHQQTFQASYAPAEGAYTTCSSRLSWNSGDKYMRTFDPCWFVRVSASGDYLTNNTTINVKWTRDDRKLLSPCSPNKLNF